MCGSRRSSELDAPPAGPAPAPAAASADRIWAVGYGRVWSAAAAAAAAVQKALKKKRRNRKEKIDKEGVILV